MIPLGTDQMAIDIGRRQFITALGGAAVAWPLAARAQQPGRLPIVGYLGPSSPENTGPNTTAFRGGPVFRNRMAAWLRWILGLITPPISPRLPA
jgi:hypothetical protein